MSIVRYLLGVAVAVAVAVVFLAANRSAAVQVWRPSDTRPRVTSSSLHAASSGASMLNATTASAAAVRTIDITKQIRANQPPGPSAAGGTRDATSSSSSGNLAGRRCDLGARVSPWCVDVCAEMEAGGLVRPGDVSRQDREYLRRHVLFALVTGSFERFFRIDIALCTWLRHLDPANFIVVTDNASLALPFEAAAGASKPCCNESALRHRQRATWVDGVLPPAVKFTKRQVGATRGYTLGWIKAQFRFIQGLEALGALAAVPGHDQHNFDAAPLQRAAEALRRRPRGEFEPRWFMVLDDDTFTSLPALVRMLREYDVATCPKDQRVPASARQLLQREGRQPMDDDDGDTASASSGYDAAANKRQPPGSAAPDGSELSDAAPPTSAKMTPPTTQATMFACALGPSDLRPTYVGERGWGGAGHLFNYAAVAKFLGPGYAPCVDRNMVDKFYASDVALRKCLPGAGVNVVADARMSHCQATFLRERLLTGRHVTAHVKREIDRQPRLFSLWRLRLYYATAYHRSSRDESSPRNSSSVEAATTAYDRLLEVGACAYGSCKIGKCREAHDTASAAAFERLSANSTMPPWRIAQ